MTNSINTAIVDHFCRAILMFRNAVVCFSAEDWKTGELDYLRPAGVAYHAVETIAFYTSGLSADKFSWGSRFNADWEDPDAAKLPTQDQVLTYMDQVWHAVEPWILASDLIQPETVYHWTGSILLSRLLYVIRHIQHHTAEMNLELKKRGYPLIDWK
ncbi:MAG: hypothetical protein P1S60_09650 [Anaerolineae bacterium]|nr:hypothetical protein [Anaerolineae bacterium]